MYAYENTDDAAEQIGELPVELLPFYAELISLLELTPWAGDPYNAEKPHGAMRRIDIGPNHEVQVSYLILEDQRRVVVLNVMWIHS